MVYSECHAGLPFVYAAETGLQVAASVQQVAESASEAKQKGEQAVGPVLAVAHPAIGAVSSSWSAAGSGK